MPGGLPGLRVNIPPAEQMKQGKSIPDGMTAEQDYTNSQRSSARRP